MYAERVVALLCAAQAALAEATNVPFRGERLGLELIVVAQLGTVPRCGGADLAGVDSPASSADKQLETSLS